MLDDAHRLSRALRDAGHESAVVAIPWRKHGIRSAIKLLRSLHPVAPDAVILHYSDLGWSRRGMPLGLLGVVVLLRRVSTNIVVWVHDPDRIRGPKLRHRLGSTAKAFGLRAAIRIAGAAVVSGERERVYWLNRRIRPRVVFCPESLTVEASLQQLYLAFGSH